MSPPPHAHGGTETNGDVDMVSVVKVRLDAVVKVLCFHSEPNFSLPWQRKRQYSSSSTGFIISGRRVLTNARSVEHYSQVKLKKRGSDTKYLAIGTECDIVPFRHGERIALSYLISQKYTGDSVLVKVLRNKNIFEFNIKLATPTRLIPPHIDGSPSYYIIAGFVFTIVSLPYLRSEYGEDFEVRAPVKLLVKYLHEMAKSEDEQIVVVSQVLVADINIGYEGIFNTQVLAFNGKPVKNLKELARMVEDCNDEFLKFDLDYQQIVVLQTKKAKAATRDILTTHCIPSAMSNDLKC